MKFKLSYYLTPEVNQKAIQTLSERLEHFFKDKYYGLDINEFYVGITCVEPQFDNFFKVRKPKYTGEKKVYTKDGVNFEIEKTLEYDIKLDYEKYMGLDEKSKERMIITSIKNSINELKTIKKISNLDFNFEQFSDELKGFDALDKRRV
jgi:hypothetical protein